MDKPVFPCARCADKASLKSHCRIKCEEYAAFDAARKACSLSVPTCTADDEANRYTQETRVRLKRMFRL